MQAHGAIFYLSRRLLLSCIALAGLSFLLFITIHWPSRELAVHWDSCRYISLALASPCEAIYDYRSWHETYIDWVQGAFRGDLDTLYHAGWMG